MLCKGTGRKFFSSSNFHHADHFIICSLDISSLFDNILGALVQAFFAHRIHILSGKWVISVISWTGSFLALVVAVLILVFEQTLDLKEFATRSVYLEIASVTLLVLVDLVNTVALCTYLKIGRTGFKDTDHMVNKLFLWTIRA